MSDDVAVLRAFNRRYTQHIGVLEDRFLGRGRPLAESRLLFEVGLDGATVLALRERLSLDSGYLSRLLRSLEDARLVTVMADPADGRRRRVELTAAGVEEWEELDRRSDELAAGLLAPLGPAQRDRLREALGTAERLLRAATAEFVVADPLSEEALVAVERYLAEIADRGVGGGAALGSASDGAETMRRPDGVFVLVRSDGDVVGCGGVRPLGDGVGEVKRMWVSPAVRGTGMGRRLLDHLEEWVRRLGHDVVRLDTNSALTQAIAMYESAGYTAIERYNDNPHAERFFEKHLR
ncbi:bifunctional helix-turn-helix transcriptional regulator/GNAT family N-acetyltransferase [Euzebya rosea]|uniref:bifunctional helix-turn-helix transcriptional regulator/GNAT family N-acetyltransferase n=1 Tax=Euzebya rosea TaxID=2052804 RepID=UPI000D3E287B|nr:helix-turn-helix domain-containing GNAT family N-acetyltransferase [Euzebya rosea]